MEVLYQVVLRNLSGSSKDWRVGCVGFLGSRGRVPVRERPELTMVSLLGWLLGPLLLLRCGSKRMVRRTVDR